MALSRIPFLCLMIFCANTALGGLNPVLKDCISNSTSLLQDESECCTAIQEALFDDSVQLRNDPEAMQELCSVFAVADHSNYTEDGSLSQRKPLLFATMIPRGRPSQLSDSSENDASQPDPSSAKEIAIRLALWHVNYCSDLKVMKDFYLKTKFFDSCCDARSGSKVYVDVIAEKMNLGVIGPGLSSVAVPTARFSSYLNLSMISYGAEASELSNRNDFRTFYRLPASEAKNIFAWMKFIRHFRWKRVAIIHELGQELDAHLTAVINALRANGNTVALSLSSFQRDFNATHVCKEIVATKATVVIAMVNVAVAKQLVCASRHTGTDSACQNVSSGSLPHHSHVWIFLGWLTDNWWNASATVRVFKTGGKTITCSASEMAASAAGSFSVRARLFSRCNKEVLISQSLRMNSTYWEKLHKTVLAKCWKELRPNNRTTQEYTRYSAYAYDAVWTYARAVNNLVNTPNWTVNDSGNLLHPTRLMRGRIVSSIQQMDSFTGVSGSISFAGADRPHPIINLWNIGPNGQEDIVGRISMPDGNLSFVDGINIYWGQGCPKGYTPKEPTMKPPVAHNEDCGNLSIFNSCSTISPFLWALVLGGIFIVPAAVAWIVKKRDKTNFVRRAQDIQDILDRANLSDQSLCELAELSREWEVSRDQITVLHVLGEGAFGQVHFGHAVGPGFSEDSSPRAVAIKMLKKESTLADKVAFLAEAKTMSQFSCPHIVKMIGVCTTSTDCCYIILEYMNHGDLKSYLQEHKQYCNTTNPDRVTSEQLTAAAIDIAKGLAYLGEHNLVHRDLAARNCLVTDDMMVKISDFGLSRETHRTGGQYVLTHHTKLPICWMAPESFNGSFSHKSDVWSYGVMVWEMATFGDSPLSEHILDGSIVHKVQQGLHVKLPRGSPGDFHAHSGHFEFSNVFLDWIFTFNCQTRPAAKDIVDWLLEHPNLIQPCLQLAVENTSQHNSPNQRSDLENNLSSINVVTDDNSINNEYGINSTVGHRKSNSNSDVADSFHRIFGETPENCTLDHPANYAYNWSLPVSRSGLRSEDDLLTDIDHIDGCPSTRHLHSISSSSKSSLFRSSSSKSTAANFVNTHIRSHAFSLVRHLSRQLTGKKKKTRARSEDLPVFPDIRRADSYTLASDQSENSLKHSATGVSSLTAGSHYEDITMDKKRLMNSTAAEKCAFGSGFVFDNFKDKSAGTQHLPSSSESKL